MKIPLFPLDIVLFPGVPLPLHIFEPRYREMVSACVETAGVFGVVRAHQDGLAVIGCTARIVRVLTRYPDGRSDILTQGVDRFEIEQLDETRSFLQAEIDLLPDQGPSASRAARQECLALHFEILELTGEGESSAGLNQGLDLDAPIAYLLASAIPADLSFHQALLGTRSDAERTETLLVYYRAMLPKLRRGAHASQRAASNGHIM
jgi:Lon protease-like protein